MTVKLNIILMLEGRATDVLRLLTMTLCVHIPGPLNSDSPYNTLDHGTQTQEKQQRLAEQTTAYEALATDTS